MPQAATALWSLALHQYEVDPAKLVEAIEDQICRDDLDYRSRLLIRDSMNALQQCWEPARFQSWLDQSRQRQAIETIWRDDFLGEVGFPSLVWRVKSPTSPQTIVQFFRKMGQACGPNTVMRLNIGGYSALVLAGLLTKRIEYIDFVDRIPEQLRSGSLEKVDSHCDFRLREVPSGRLPLGWQNRAQHLDDIGGIEVYIVDVYDVAVCRLLSSHGLNLDDTRFLTASLRKVELTNRFKLLPPAVLRSDEFQFQAQRHWYILFGEYLPS